MMRARRTAVLLLAALLLSTGACADIPVFRDYRTARSAEWEIADGVTYRRFELTPLNGPAGQSQRLFMVEIGKDAVPRVRLHAAPNTGKLHKNLETLPEILEGWEKTHSPQILAAVNGDFFDTASGGSLGFMLADGRWLHLGEFPDSFAVGMKSDGTPVIGRPRAALRLYLPGGESLPVDALNALRADAPASASSPDNARAARKDNQLVLYTAEFDRTTATQPGGTEVRLRASGPIRSGEATEATVEEVRTDKHEGSMTIGEGYMVLSGVREAADILKELRPGDTVRIECTVSEAFADAVTVIGGGRPDGGPLLVRDGEPTDLEPGIAISVDHTYFYRRHPRTIFGIYPDGGYFLLLIEGNRSGSYGMKLEWAQRILVDLGAQTAFNLDGGPSSTMVILQNERIRTVSDTTGGVHRLTKVGSALILTEGE